MDGQCLESAAFCSQTIDESCLSGSAAISLNWILCDVLAHGIDNTEVILRGEISHLSHAFEPDIGFFEFIRIMDADRLGKVCVRIESLYEQKKR